MSAAVWHRNPRNMDDLYGREISRAGFAEGIACLCLTIILGGALAGTPATIGALSFSVVYGFGVAAFTFATGYVSGGHLSPAITLAHFLLGRMTAVNVLWYWLMQFFGGALGAVWLRFTTAEKHWDMIVPNIPDESNITKCILWELVGSFFVVFVFLNVMDDIKRVGKYGPISVGLAVSAAVLATWTYSMAGLNPAVRGWVLPRNIPHGPQCQRASDPGQAEEGGVDVRMSFWLSLTSSSYMVIPLVGGGLAALATRVMLPISILERKWTSLSKPDSDYEVPANHPFDDFDT